MEAANSVTYYKIVRDGAVIDAYYTFLKWSQGRRRLICCGVDDAQFAQGYDGTVYHDYWMAAVPEAVTEYETATVAIIDAVEYDELRAELDDGETVQDTPEPDPEPTPEHEPEPEPTPEPERPMTVQEMRERIAELTAQVLNASEPFTAEKTYNAGDVIANGARVYIAGQVIIRGETVTPGANCEETTIADVINALQARNEEE